MKEHAQALDASEIPCLRHPNPRQLAREPLCGILNVDKPAGMTSHDVVAAVRRSSRQRKAGHAGTLDPMATGVLLVCLGAATRVSEYLMATPKTYRAGIRLGLSTTTNDAEGEITGETAVEVTRPEIEVALQRFVGRISQVPPMYSAIKRNGVKLYKLARKGMILDVPPRQVEIYDINLTAWTPPLLHVEVRCGPGTYVRALARDLGDALGCGAHLASLRRTASGQFTVGNALSLERLQGAFAAGSISEDLHPLDAALSHLPALHLDTEAAYRLALGQKISDPAQTLCPPRGGDREGARTGTLARAYAPRGRFVAIVSWDEDSTSWRPRKVFVRAQELIPPLENADARTDE